VDVQGWPGYLMP